MTHRFKALPPGSTLGVMGGGQLGWMFVHAAQTLGYQTVVLDPDLQSPAGRVSHHHITTAYTDATGLKQMAEMCDAVTTEFENVPAASLQQLMQTVCVSPQAHAVAIAQDRAEEKKYFVQCDVPVAPHHVILHTNDLQKINAALLPGILKTTRMGYDGKGQVRVNNDYELKNAWHALQGTSTTPVVCILEKMLSLTAECSVIVARSHDGQMVHLPVQCNLHRNGILAITEVFKNNLKPAFEQQAIESAKKIAQGLQYIGVLCVEFFVLSDGSLLVNEIAPRPHNSGHYSINGCDVSQFELQVRCMAGLPLTQPRLHSASILLNLLGDLWHTPNNSMREPNWSQVLSLSGMHLHLYGKNEAKVGRKMGHLTVTGVDIQETRQRAHQAASILGIDTW